MSKVTELVEKIEMKYERTKDENGNQDSQEILFFKDLILCTNRIQNEYSIIHNRLKIRGDELDNIKEPVMLIQMLLNTIDLVSMDLKRGIKIEINNDVCLPKYVRCDKSKLISILSSLLEISHIL